MSGDWVIEGDFAGDGAVCVRGAFTSEHVAMAEQAIEANLATLSPLAKRASADDDGAFVEDFCNWAAVIADGALHPRVARRPDRCRPDGVLDGAPVSRPRVGQGAGTLQRTSWHQDQPYDDVEGRHNASMWFPVDAVDRSSTLEFVAGTHRGPWYMPRTFLDDRAAWFPEGALAEMPDFAADPERWRVIGWELEPGDAVFFDMSTVHGSGGASGPGRRRVLSIRFLGDDMVHAPRDWDTSPPVSYTHLTLPTKIV